MTRDIGKFVPGVVELHPTDVTLIMLVLLAQYEVYKVSKVEILSTTVKSLPLQDFFRFAWQWHHSWNDLVSVVACEQRSRSLSSCSPCRRWSIMPNFRH